MSKPSVQPPEANFGHRLRQWRNSRNHSLREFCGGVGLSIAYVCDLENGKRGISLSNALKIAAYTGRKLDWFLKEDANA